jgi:hypothetical protein
MNKHKALFVALAFSFAYSALATLPVGAVNEAVNGAITVTGDEDPSTGNGEVYTDGEATPISETEGNAIEETQPIDDDCIDSTDEDCQSRPETYDTELENALDEGLANEPEVICATGDEPGCEDDTNTEMWPLYISLGALGATIILVIIINLFGRKKK